MSAETNAGKRELAYARTRKWRALNREKISEYNRAYQIANAEKIAMRVSEYKAGIMEVILKKARDYYWKNRDRILEQKRKFPVKMDDLQKKSRHEYIRKYQIENREALSKKDLDRYHNNPKRKLSATLRTRLLVALKGKMKAGSAIALLGCPAHQAVEYISRLFKPGMSWDNHGDWHIDHKRPLSAFDLQDPNQLAKACHYSNLQPLWAGENLSKGARL